MEQIIKNSLEVIFNEIDKIKNIIYLQISHKRLENTHDIWEALTDTKFYEYIDEFRINIEQYDADKVLNTIKDYIDYKIELLVEENQWQ